MGKMQSDMDEHGEMKQDALTGAAQAYEAHQMEKDVSKFIKVCARKLFGSIGLVAEMPAV